MISVEPTDGTTKDWALLIDNSHQTSLYVMPEWMALHPVHAFIAKRGTSVVGGIVAVDGLSPTDFVPYQGTLLLRSEDREVMQAMLSHVERLQTPISVWNPPSMIDVRPFFWRFYDAQRSWIEKIRYTYFCDKSCYPEWRARKNVTGKEVWQCKDAEWFARWSHQPWVSESDHDRLRKILAMPSTTVWQDQDATVVWGTDHQGRGYYLASVGKPTNIIVSLMKRHKSVDLVGANSPARSLFKRSFGGHLRTYYGMQLVS